MSAWAEPGVAHLEDVVRSAEGRLLLCSPYISTPALDIVAAALPPAVRTVEVWTRLEARDWLTGVSDPEGLLDFMRQIEDRVGQVAVRHSERLHAKVIVSDGPRGLAGSANLTMGGFVHNVEAVRIVAGDETPRLRALAEGMRQRLRAVSREQFEEFVAGCTAHLDSREALLDLIRTEMPTPRFGPQALMPYARFLEYVERYDSEVAGQVVAIARNRDGNNNTGKVKQAFFGVSGSFRSTRTGGRSRRACPTTAGSTWRARRSSGTGGGSSTTSPTRRTRTTGTRYRRCGATSRPRPAARARAAAAATTS